MTDDRKVPALEQRIAALEARVTQLEAANPQAARTAPPGSPPVVAVPRPERSPAAWWRSVLTDSGEGLLGRAGVALLVVGIVLLYRYAVERGWLTPELRIGIGLAVGAALLAGGVFLFHERRRYRQILMGGGFVILFITGLAATELYHLVSGAVALAFFMLLAGTAFLIAARQHEPIIASIGALGALISPSFLLTGTAPGVMLWLYLLVMVVWIGVLTTLRGWERTFVIAAAASVLAMFHEVPPHSATRLAAVMAVLAVWGCYAVLPLVRERISTAWSRPEVLLVVPPAVTLGLAAAVASHVWSGTLAFELGMAIAAAGFAVTALWLRGSHTQAPTATVRVLGRPVEFGAYGAAAVASAAGFAVALAAGIDAPWRWLPFAVIALAAVLLARSAALGLLRPLAHALNALVALIFLLSMEVLSRKPSFDQDAAVFTLAAACAAGAAFILPSRTERLVHWGAVYFVMHVLLATELSAVAAAPWLATAAYGVVGSTLLVGGLAQRQMLLQRAGLLSLALLVARLFLFDLATASFGVRVVLFMAAGFGFLGLGYLVRLRRFST